MYDIKYNVYKYIHYVNKKIFWMQLILIISLKALIYIYIISRICKHDFSPITDCVWLDCIFHFVWWIWVHTDIGMNIFCLILRRNQW